MSPPFTTDPGTLSWHMALESAYPIDELLTATRALALIAIDHCGLSASAAC